MLDEGARLLSSAIAVLLCMTVHECSHGLVSYWLGDPTAKRMGRLSLNPFHHLDWIGALFMLVFRFGWAKPVPINPNYYKNFRLGTVLVSIAGPISNILLAFLTLLIYGIVQIFVPVHELVLDFIWTMILMNLGLAVFNCLPIPPLDGSKVVFALLPEKAYRFVLRYERYGFILLIALVYLNDTFDGLLNRGVDNLTELLLHIVNTIILWIVRFL
ncbi:MAG: site-2 protease family protein [Ruminococcaceae bacterium]|nr:site-2 protease family protein [Oscillospiraceae bacterium]